MSKDIRRLDYMIRKLRAQEANKDTFIERIERSKREMTITQYRQGKSPASKYEVHGVQKRVNKRAAQFALHKKYAMS